MKRSCATCLWWCWDGDNNTSERHGLCRYVQPGARVSPAAWPITVESDFCAAWEPRDRSLVRCETCDYAVFTTSNEGGICLLNPPQVSANGAVYVEVWRCSRCSHWRLREEQDNS